MHIVAKLYLPVSYVQVCLRNGNANISHVFPWKSYENGLAHSVVRKWELLLGMERRSKTVMRLIMLCSVPIVRAVYIAVVV